MINLDFLTETGLLIYEMIKTHCKKLKLMDADVLEMSMLANSFDMYYQAAFFCKENGNVVAMATKTGTYEMLRPEYNIMKNEYANVLKHSAKFGLNPGDREKIFKNIKPPKKSITEGLD